MLTDELLHASKFPEVYNVWSFFRGPSMTIERWLHSVIAADIKLLTLMRQYVGHATVHTRGDAFARLVPRFDLARFLQIWPADIGPIDIEARVNVIEAKEQSLSAEQREVIELFGRAVRLQDKDALTSEQEKGHSS